jgi:hypothetical protein
LTAQYRDVDDLILSDGTINRIAAVFGWFVTDNILAKVEYVQQSYDGFPATSIFNEGQFSGIMLSGAVGF